MKGKQETSNWCPVSDLGQHTTASSTAERLEVGLRLHSLHPEPSSTDLAVEPNHCVPPMCEMRIITVPSVSGSWKVKWGKARQVLGTEPGLSRAQLVTVTIGKTRISGEATVAGHNVFDLNSILWIQIKHIMLETSRKPENEEVWTRDVDFILEPSTIERATKAVGIGELVPEV